MTKRDSQPQLTMTGTILFACMVAFWIYCAASRVINPSSIIGTFVGDAKGVIAVAVGSVLFGGIAGAVLERLGHPIVKKSSPND